MSVALESLMREVPVAAAKRQNSGMLFNFAGVGAIGALAYVVVSSALIWLHGGLADWLVSTACYGVMMLPLSVVYRRQWLSADAAQRQTVPHALAAQSTVLALAAAASYGTYAVFAVPNPLASIVVVALTASLNNLALRGWAFAHRRTRLALAA